MKILYSYITVASEGGKVHIDSFVNAYRSLSETVVENGLLMEPYAGGKESWSVGKRLIVKLRWFTANMRHFWRTLRTARMHKPDVLLFRFQPLHEFLLSIVGLSFVYPVVLEVNAVRSIENHKARPRISDYLDHLSLSCASRSFVVSQRLREHIVEHYHLDARRIGVIENGVDVEEFHPATTDCEVRRKLGLENRLVVGFVGSFRPWHGINYLITLAEEVVPQIPEVFFLLVGDGADRQLYERKVHELGLTGHFAFTGRVEHAEVPRFLVSMDVVMAPVVKGSFSGEFHGSPLKIFEYMAMAKAVIAPPLGQVREVIEHGISGLLIDSDDTHNLAQAILNLHRDPLLRKRLGENARARVMERYTWKSNAAKVKSLCAEACHV